MRKSAVRFSDLHTILVAFSRQMLSKVSSMMAEREPPNGHAVVIQKGSYNPADGTVHVTVMRTASVFGDDGDVPISILSLPLLKTDPNDHYAPVGGEHGILVPIEQGYGVKLHNEVDDALGAGTINPGERWIVHKDQTGPPGLEYQGAINAFIKLLNDGAVAGDAKGGLVALAGSLLSLATGGNHTIVADDNAKTITLQTGGGLKIVMSDDAAKIYLNGTALGAGDALVRQSDMQAAFNTFAEGVMAGDGAPPPMCTGSETVFSA